MSLSLLSYFLNTMQTPWLQVKKTEEVWFFLFRKLKISFYDHEIIISNFLLSSLKKSTWLWLLIMASFKMIKQSREFLNDILLILTFFNDTPQILIFNGITLLVLTFSNGTPFIKFSFSINTPLVLTFYINLVMNMIYP